MNLGQKATGQKASKGPVWEAREEDGSTREVQLSGASRLIYN